MSTTNADFFHFDKERRTWVCPEHGDVESTWLPCFAGCNDGCFDLCFDLCEGDPLMFDDGDMKTCGACDGEGGWRVCGECNIDNPDAEF